MKGDDVVMSRLRKVRNFQAIKHWLTLGLVGNACAHHAGRGGMVTLVKKCMSAPQLFCSQLLDYNQLLLYRAARRMLSS
jgi:hypothetical protein